MSNIIYPAEWTARPELDDALTAAAALDRANVEAIVVELLRLDRSVERQETECFAVKAGMSYTSVQAKLGGGFPIDAAESFPSLCAFYDREHAFAAARIIGTHLNNPPIWDWTGEFDGVDAPTLGDAA